MKVYWIESPLFEITTEDGPASSYNLQIVAEVGDRKYTYAVTFEAWDKVGVQKMVDSLQDRGCLEMDWWNEGTSWDWYATSQTRTEEQLEAQWREGS